MRQPKLLVSIFILLVIALHGVAALRRGQTQTYWPFLKWGMYKDSRPPGPIQAEKRRIVGVTQTGKTEEVTSNLVGLSGSTMGRLYVRPMMDGDSLAARQLLDRLNRERVDSFVELRLEVDRYTLTDSGIVKQENPISSYRAVSTESR